MNRRQFLLFSAAALSAVRGAAATAPALTLPLWPDQPPGGGGPGGEARLSARGALSHIPRPVLTVWQPARATGHGVLVAAGGGYQRIEMGSEAWPAAHWLTAHGYTAYVLSYRLPGEGWQAGALAPLQDAQRALRLIRARESQVSVLGFSAGGHLLGMAACRTAFSSYPPEDALDHQPATADGAALIYPVITLLPPWSHTATHRLLVGPQASEAADRAWSVQTWVTTATPPCFLVQAQDDPISDPHNTLLMADACRQHQVPVQLFRYTRGGHGFGMGRPGTPTTAWPTAYAAWLKALASTMAQKS
ncbi:acetylesterase [Klebsiella variicola]|uniref:alpha/beta hydrolase n=1 Tax=Klebsiella variicola TaxID=244366 RepID=UPI00125679A1|nr:alpha/beta hydrolase [Klebsiella variicola]VAN12858.1 acetylesterase [Klebsiella variicola]